VYRPSTGEVIVPNGGSWTAIEALVAKPGGYDSFAGTIDDEGLITIPGVPQGPYLLALTNLPSSTVSGAQLSKSYYATSSRALELGAVYSGRPDRATITKPTLLLLDATLSIPWKTYTEDDKGNVLQALDDQLQFVSRNGSVTGRITAAPSEASKNPPADGAQALSAWSIDARSAFDDLGYLTLIDGSKGDDFALLHDVSEQVGMFDEKDPWSAYVFTSSQEVFLPSSFSMTNGGTSVLSGSFTKIPQKTFALDYKGTSFNALFAGLPIDYVFVDLRVNLEAGAPEPAIGAYPELLHLDTASLVTYENPACAGPACNEAGCANGCDLGTLVPPGDHAHSFSYGNPFDFGQELVTLSVFFQKSVKALLPEMTSEYLNGLFTLQMPVAELDGKAMVPTLGLPEEITVDGKKTPYDQVSAGIGTTPALAWKAPSLGTPTHYRVTVIDLTDLKANDGSTLRRRAVAVFKVTEPHVTLPDGILKAGKFYYFQVAAVARDDDDLSRPFSYPVHEARATMFTGVVTP
jgi:hypothetical protein